MARDRTGFVNRSLRGLRLSDAVGVSAGTKLFAPEDVGVLTSVAITPGQGGVGLGYLRRGFETIGTKVRVGTVEGPVAEVVEIPIR